MVDTQGNGTIRFGEALYCVNEENCLLVAYISESGIAWKLTVEGRVNDDDEESDEFFSMYLFFVDSTLTDWRDFANRQYIVRADNQTLFPLLPDNPSGAYSGIHYSVNNHQVHFGDRVGNSFQVSWKCEARLDENDKQQVRVEFNGPVQFDGLVVKFDREFRKIMDSLPPDPSNKDINSAYEEWQPDLRKAGLLIAEHFDLLEFENPLKWRAALRYHLRK